MRQKKSEKVAPKIHPLPGGIASCRVKCGRANCKCTKGELHGPYYYWRIQYNGKRRKKYIKPSEFSAYQKGIQEHRRQQAEIRAINEEAKANWRVLREHLRNLDKLLKIIGE